MAGNSVKSGLLVHFPSHLSPAWPKAPISLLFVTLEFVEVAGSGGRDRTADLGVMNAGHPVDPIPSNL